MLRQLPITIIRVWSGHGERLVRMAPSLSRQYCYNKPRHDTGITPLVA